MENNKFFSNNSTMKIIVRNIAFRFFTIMAIFLLSYNLKATAQSIKTTQKSSLKSSSINNRTAAETYTVPETYVHASGRTECSGCNGTPSGWEQVLYMPSTLYSYNATEMPRSVADRMTGNWATTTTSELEQTLLKVIPLQLQSISQRKVRQLTADASIVVTEVVKGINSPMGQITITPKFQTSNIDAGVFVVLKDVGYNSQTFVSVNASDATAKIGGQDYLNGGGTLGNNVSFNNGKFVVSQSIPLGAFFNSFQNNVNNIVSGSQTSILNDVLKNQPKWGVQVNDFYAGGVYVKSLDLKIDPNANTGVATVNIGGVVTVTSGVSLNKNVVSPTEMNLNIDLTTVLPPNSGSKLTLEGRAFGGQNDNLGTTSMEFKLKY